MLRALLIGLAVIVGLLVFNFIFWHLLGLIAMVLWIGIALAAVAGIGYVVFSLLQKDKQPAQPAVNYKIFDTRNPHVQVYRSEPTIQDLVSTAAGLGAEDEGQAFNIANDTRVSILEDRGRESIKVKILDKGAKEKVGWVARSSLVKESKAI